MTDTLASALVAAQKAMPAVADNASANYGTYVTLDHLIAKTRSILNDHGLAIVQFPTVTELGAPALRTILVHGATGETMQADGLLFMNGKTDMQALGGAITYGRRYAWGAALGISTDQDDDGQQISAKPAAATDEKPADGAAVNNNGTVGNGTGSTEFKFGSGKYSGKTLAEVPRDYLDWYLANGPKQDVKEAIRVVVALGDAFGPSATPDDDIPF